MINKKTLFILIVVSFPLCAEPIPQDPRVKQFSELTEKDLANLRTKAIEGDGLAANQLFLHFSAFGKDRSGIDGFEWLIIAAKNKNPSAIASLKTLKDQGTIDTWINALIKSDEVKGDQ